MISYALRCDNGHGFDSWFQNSAAFDKQVKRGLVTCPVCDSAKVEKAIMAPRLGRKSSANAARAVPESVTETAPPATPPSAPVTLMSEGEQELRSKIRELHDHVMKIADNVGKRFPEEARKIHYGEEKARPIVGEASLQEAKALIEEGIGVAPLPVLPDDRN